jgi:peptide/nickel transport system substrate-binding protein
MASKHWRWLLAVVAGFSLLAAACGGDDDDESGGGTTTEASGEVPEGGELVIGAEQEPDCTDWIASCSGSSWGYWMMNVNTMPRAYTVAWDGETATYEATELLDGEPELVTEPKQVVTYKLNPDVTWNDGTPVSADDFVYTWDQIANGEDIYDTTGYSQIESVEAPDPQTAVVTYSTPYPGWKALFGGGYGILPSHLLEGKDRAAEMANGYTFSAGPWVIESWEKGTAVTLVPNENYWGDKPKLDKVTFRFITDTAAGFQALQNGEVSAIYPQPQLDAVEQISNGLEGINSVVNDRTGNIEALWMNNAAPPFESEAVRQAVAYSLDRDAIVERLFGGIGVTEAAQALEPALVGEYTDLEAFADYTLDLDKVTELMEGDGWAKGSDGIWAKGGQKASFSIKSTAGNARRELTEQIVQEQLKAAGFEMTIDNQEAGDLFGQILPSGDFQLALYAQVLTTLEPGACTLFCAANIPTPENDNSGQNWTRTELSEADNGNLEALDTELDQEARAEAGKAGMDALAATVASLPLDPLPNILLWSDSVVGNVVDNPVMGPFFTLHEWGVQS